MCHKIDAALNMEKTLIGLIWSEWIHDEVKFLIDHKIAQIYQLENINILRVILSFSVILLLLLFNYVSNNFLKWDLHLLLR